MTTTTKAQPTKTPGTRPALTPEGIATGMLITLAPSVALSQSGQPVSIPAGSVISGVISAGWNERLKADAVTRTYGSVQVSFLA